MTDFHDVRFPQGIAYGSSGGPERHTDIVTLVSGHEERNSLWADSRRRFNAGYGVHSLDDLHAVIAFFEARQGRLYGFRFRDPADYKSCLPSNTPAKDDQTLTLPAADNPARFLLTKTYTSGSYVYQRPIAKPRADSVLVAVDNVLQTKDADYTLNSSTGEILFQQSSVPAAGAKVSAGFSFDVPVRFDTDYLAINFSAFQAGEIPDIPLVEIRLD